MVWCGVGVQINVFADEWSVVPVTFVEKIFFPVNFLDNSVEKQ